MNTPKIIAFYLPQFHEIEENNRWWGQGFTEWTNVRRGRPLFRNHYQPKIPLDDNYYSLDHLETLAWQAELARKYEVDAFCFYHYWFHGKLLLEKPMEMLLENTDVDISYCISWANETWSRRWTGEEKNILIKQEYGNRDDWESHIKYLIRFFSDRRYLKIGNKPVLILYRAMEIPNCEEMVTYWEKRLKEEGFAGLYLIETLNSVQRESVIKNSDALVRFEPMYTIYKTKNYLVRLYRYAINHMRLYRFGFRNYLNYDWIYSKIRRENKKREGKTVYLGVFPEWDNTARKGNAGLVIRGGNPDKFRYYFEGQYQASMESDKEYIFINAWNEWGEGAYLEPDSKNGFQYLQAIKDVVHKYREKNGR